MKTHIKNMFLLPALLAGLGLMLAGRVTAQTFTTLYDFTSIYNPDETNSDGANPFAGPILSGKTLYGTAWEGGNGGEDGNGSSGTVFAVNTNGTGFTVLHTFAAGDYDDNDNFTNSDGANPEAGLILVGNTLYGTTFDGTVNGYGSIFKVNTDGTGFTTLHTFIISEGTEALAGLILSGNTLYGTAGSGGVATNGSGTVFAVNINGTGFTVLHKFSSLDLFGNNYDGAGPSGLILSGNTLYGTAYYGGSSGYGTVFAVNTDGTGFTTLHNFTATTGGTNGDGADPEAGLILSGNTLYGTASKGGSSSDGTVFAVNTNGTGFTTLHNFTTTAPYPNVTNSDGANPYAGLVLSGNTLYGTAINGGTYGSGTVFAVNTNGTGFTSLYSFTVPIEGTIGYFIAETNSDGFRPYAGLILSGNTLYGTAWRGGSGGSGTVFGLSLPLPVSAPQLTIMLVGINAILTWPTNTTGFNLQSAPTMSATFTNIPDATSPYTNPITGTQKFYRLSQ